MDPRFSGEDLVIKARKPYTITKQRERWKEEEHNRFLEALKLYGRAWQRIEEHIGTKTAVQIRSHAQKFFTKLEKEGAVKGAGNALDFDIPPTRPKKKPTNPYPRKTGGNPVLQLRLKDGKPPGASSTSLNIAEIEDLSACAKLENNDHENDDVNLDTVAPCASPTSTNGSLASEASERSCTFRQFLPLVNGSRIQNGSAEEKRLLNDSVVTMDVCVSPEESSQGEMVHDPNDEGSHHNCPRHVPVHILGSTQCQFMKSIPNQTAGVHGDRTLNTNAAASTTENGGHGPRSAIPLPYLHGHMVNPEEYQSFMQMSSTFSSLVVSALAQNAAMYAAATSFASSLWPWFNLEIPLNPSVNSSGIPRPMNPNPSMDAIAGATAVAATAWWAANGLLPLCPQYHPGFAFSPSSTTAAQMPGCQSGNMDGEAGGNSGDPTPYFRQPDAEHFSTPNLTSKPTSSSSDSEATSEAEKLDGGVSLNVEAEESDGSNKCKTIKQLDQSTSGSNTLTISELEPDATETNVKVNEENQIKTKVHTEDNAVLSTIDPSSLGSRSRSNLSDPWNGVSDYQLTPCLGMSPDMKCLQGRLAFQALFSREVLPQSFSPPHDLKNKANIHCIMPVEDEVEPSIRKLDSNENSPLFDIMKKQDIPQKSDFDCTRDAQWRLEKVGPRVSTRILRSCACSPISLQ